MGKSPGLRLQASVVQDNLPVEVAPRVFVGSVHAAFHLDALKERQITHVLNLAGHYATFPDAFTYLSMHLRDKEDANLLSCLPAALIFVEAALRDPHSGGVLIHCAGGRSRSPAVAVAYLMIHDLVSFDTAYTRMRALRPVVGLNAGFEAQLRSLEVAHGDIYAAHQIMLKQRIETLAQQREDGQLEAAVALIKRRRAAKSQATPTIPATPTTPRGKRCFADDEEEDATRDRDSEHKPQTSTRPFCDERGTLHGCVPSGFLLSLPASSASVGRRKEGTSVTHFLPTLRSMGTMVGCRACSENLFCTSAVIAHDECRRASADRKSAKGTDSTTSDADKKAKRPLLAKLRLRPHSPKDGIDSRTGLENPGTPPKTGVIKPPKKDTGDRSRDPNSTPTPPSTASATEAAGEHKHHGEHSSFWSSLKALKYSKRLAKEHAAEKDDEKHKAQVQSPKSIDLASPNDLSREEPSQQRFLRENIAHWEQKLRIMMLLRRLPWRLRHGSAPRSRFASTAQLPIIQLDGTSDHVSQLADAFAEFGCCYLQGHGITRALERDVMASARAFCALPTEVKRAIPVVQNGQGFTRGYIEMGKEMHRVIADDRERYSMVFFYYPDFDAVIPRPPEQSALRIGGNRGDGGHDSFNNLLDGTVAKADGCFGEYIMAKWAGVQR
ncbi:hypothetical protein P43SY_008949 [Pythium insidiosum]|uniref:Uncharacterized protein n=1 Tax=Pythium insidiosum TaxID=114742 RepID=A0AAD5LS36_PYTIN|nr:hypothetical protein P43SY_008949 [Pythium insidiosum]